MQRISAIMEIDPQHKNIERIIVLDHLRQNDEKILLDFDYTKDKIDKSVKLYRNIALLMKLIKKEEVADDDWNAFLKGVFPKTQKVSKLDNMFISHDNRKLLLVTNRRLMMVDIKRLNEKLAKINENIREYNATITVEAAERNGFLEKVRKIFS